MDVAKSLFASRDHAGYVGKSEHSVSSFKWFNMLKTSTYAGKLILIIYFSENSNLSILKSFKVMPD